MITCSISLTVPANSNIQGFSFTFNTKTQQEPSVLVDVEKHLFETVPEPRSAATTIQEQLPTETLKEEPAGTLAAVPAPVVLCNTEEIENKIREAARNALLTQVDGFQVWDLIPLFKSGKTILNSVKELTSIAPEERKVIAANLFHRAVSSLSSTCKNLPSIDRLQHIMDAIFKGASVKETINAIIEDKKDSKA